MNQAQYRMEKPLGMGVGVAMIFDPMLAEADYTWTKRAGVAGAGVLLGLLAAKTMGGKGDYVETPQQARKEANPAIQVQHPTHQAPVQQTPFQSPELTVDEAKDFIAPSEGVRDRVYKDSRGKRTVGVGFNLQQPGAAKLMRDLGINYTAVRTGQRRLTDDEVDRLFTRKVEDAIRAAQRLVRSYEDQPKQVQLAIVDMIYNLGPTGFSGFDDAIAYLERKHYTAAARALSQSDWRRQVGPRAEKIISMIRSAANTVVARNDRPQVMRESIDDLFGML